MPSGRSFPAVYSSTHILRKKLGRRATLCAAVCASLLVLLCLTGAAALARRQAQGASAKKEPAEAKKETQQGGQEQGRGLVAPTAPVVPSFKADTQAFALVIGVSKYTNLPPKAQLKYADADAQAMHDFLVSDKGGFLPQNVTLLVNEQATREQVVREIERLQNVSGPGSLVLIYFAGHGVVNPSQQGFLLASDSQVGDLMLTGIDMGLFNSALQKMRSRSVVIMSDACHSGAIGDLLSRPGASGSVTNLSTGAFAEPASRRDQTSFIFSASSPSQPSVEKEKYGHGLFTYYMLQGLGGEAEADADGIVTSTELYAYVAKKIGEESVKADVKQVPEYNPSYDKSIPLAVVAEPGRTKYRQWFDSDPMVTRWAASFDDAVKAGRLTRPQEQSAWDYYVALANYGPTPPKVAAEKRESLLTHLKAEADRVIEQAPTDPSQWDEARGNLEKAFELTRDNSLRAKQFFSSVMYYHLLGETGRAERECDNTLSLMEDGQSNDPLISVKIGQFYASIKKWEKARRAYRLAMGNSPAVPWVTEYAEVLVQLGSFPEAEEQARLALKGDPKYPRALKLLAEVLLQNPQKGRLDEALASITSARELAPDDIDAEEMFGRVLLAKGEARRAVESLLKVALRRPAGGLRDRSLLFLGRAYAQSGDLGRAISALREGADAGSHNVEVYDALANFLSERGDVAQAVEVAQKAAALTRERPAESAERLRLVAEYLERGGQHVEAAYKYREAGRTTPDAKLGTTYETRARVLFLRANRPQDAGPLPRVITQVERQGVVQRQSPLIIPGGLDALEHLSGVRVGEGDSTSLARVFDAALVDPVVASRLGNFYTLYPEFAKKVGRKGGGVSGSLELPASGQMITQEAKEALKFFGVEDKKGRREVKEGEFERRRGVLEALGGDPDKLRRGEAVTIKFQNAELPALLGAGAWERFVKDMVKVRPEEQILAFLQDPQAMRLYVGLSQMPEDAARQFQEMVITKENIEDVPSALYFAAPYLRFTPQGDLYIPGQRQGELNWQRMLKSLSASQSPQLLFKKDNGGALYLFCALSAAGEAGDFIARAPGFEQLFKLMQKSNLPFSREPFDFIDLIGFLRLQGDQLRLPKAAALWFGQSDARGAGDPLFTLLSRAGKFTAGQQVPFVKQIAVLTQVERERPDWTSNPKVVELITVQVEAGREAQLELALDLQMSDQQLAAYFTRITQIEAIQLPAAKTATLRLFQSAFALLRQVAKNSSIDQNRVSGLTDGLLQLDVSGGRLAPDTISFLRNELLGAAESTTGEHVESKLADLLAAEPPIALPASVQGKQQPSMIDLYFDASSESRQRINTFVSGQKVTRLSSVAEAAAALAELASTPSSAEALARLKAAAEKFEEPAREPEPGKKKKKQRPVVQALTFKESAARLLSPVPPQVVSEMNLQLAPFAGEALLAYAYAASWPDGSNGPADPDLVREHDFAASPWGDTSVGTGGKIGGGVARLSRALARRASVGLSRADAPGVNDAWTPTFTATTLESVLLVDRRQVTNRAGEYVARAMDMGEDALALSFLGDRTAAQVLTRLDSLLSPRRAAAVSALANRGDINSAIQALTPSELYAIGQSYFERQLEETPASKLAGEPGPLGALARVAAVGEPDATTQVLSAELLRELSQFGAVTDARTGLHRLGLYAPEPYEYGGSFRENVRLAERLYDLKLAIIRRAHRMGGTSGLMLSPAFSLEALRRVLSEARKATDGTLPPNRDWQSPVAIIQSLDERTMALLLNQLAASNYARQSPRGKWDDGAPPKP